MANAAIDFFISGPEDVLSIIFQMLHPRDCARLFLLSRGVGLSFRLTLKDAWTRAARASLSTFLPAGPLFTLSPFYNEQQALEGTLGAWFGEQHAAVTIATGRLCKKLAGAYGTSAEASRALQYTFSFARPDPASSSLHLACVKYGNATPVRAAPVVPSALEGLELYKCVAAALTCDACGARGAAERQCAGCGVLLCRGRACSISCSRDHARGEACAFALCVDCHGESSIEGRPAVFDLDEELALAQPLCEECGEDLVCPLHQCCINCTCESCGGLRCMKHTLVDPIIDYCQASMPGCLWGHHDRPACAPAAGSIAYCSGCWWHYCASCFPQMRCPGAAAAGGPGGGSACDRCFNCYKHGTCPGCQRRD